MRNSLNVELGEYYRNGPGNGDVPVRMQRRSLKTMIVDELGINAYKEMQKTNLPINNVAPYDFQSQSALMAVSYTDENRPEEDSISNINNPLENTMELQV